MGEIDRKNSALNVAESLEASINEDKRKMMQDLLYIKAHRELDIPLYAGDILDGRDDDGWDEAELNGPDKISPFPGTLSLEDEDGPLVNVELYDDGNLAFAVSKAA